MYRIKSNQIKSLLLSHHHSTSALVSGILTSVLQTVQKNTYIYSVHTVYYKDVLSYQYTLYTVCTHSTLCTHLYIVICEGATDCTLYNRLVVQQIVVQRYTRLCICNVVDVLCMVSSDSRCVCV